MHLQPNPHHCVGRYPKTQTNTQKQLFLGFSKQFFKFLWDIRIFMSKHTKTHQNNLKTLKKQQGTTLEVMGDKIPRICIKNTYLPPHT